MSETEYLVCPNHSGEVVRLVESAEDDEWPVQQVYNHTTGEFYLKNVLTGGIVDSEERKSPPMMPSG
jgi:hypothetical protein